MRNSIMQTFANTSPIILRNMSMYRFVAGELSFGLRVG